MARGNNLSAAVLAFVLALAVIPGIADAAWEWDEWQQADDNAEDKISVRGGHGSLKYENDRYQWYWQFRSDYDRPIEFDWEVSCSEGGGTPNKGTSIVGPGQTKADPGWWTICRGLTFRVGRVRTPGENNGTNPSTSGTGGSGGSGGSQNAGPYSSSGSSGGGPYSSSPGSGSSPGAGTTTTPPGGSSPQAHADADADGIPDVDDDCPAAAEDLDGVEDGDGCPEGNPGPSSGTTGAGNGSPGGTATPAPTATPKGSSGGGAAGSAEASQRENQRRIREANELFAQQQREREETSRKTEELVRTESEQIAGVLAPALIAASEVKLEGRRNGNAGFSLISALAGSPYMRNVRDEYGYVWSHFAFFGIGLDLDQTLWLGSSYQSAAIEVGAGGRGFMSFLMLEAPKDEPVPPGTDPLEEDISGFGADGFGHVRVWLGPVALTGRVQYTSTWMGGKYYIQGGAGKSLAYEGFEDATEGGVGIAFDLFRGERNRILLFEPRWMPLVDGSPGTFGIGMVMAAGKMQIRAAGEYRSDDDDERSGALFMGTVSLGFRNGW